MGTPGSRRRNRARRLRERKQRRKIKHKPLSNTARGCLMWIVFLGFVIIKGAHVTYENTNRAVVLEMNGVRTQALIVKRTNKPKYGAWFTYEFNIEGTTYANSVVASESEYEVGQTIEIMYSRDDPTINDTMDNIVEIKKTKYYKRKYAKKLSLQNLPKERGS